MKTKVSLSYLKRVDNELNVEGNEVLMLLPCHWVQSQSGEEFHIDKLTDEFLDLDNLCDVKTDSDEVIKDAILELFAESNDYNWELGDADNLGFISSTKGFEELVDADESILHKFDYGNPDDDLFVCHLNRNEECLLPIAIQFPVETIEEDVDYECEWETSEHADWWDESCEDVYGVSMSDSTMNKLIERVKSIS